MSDIEGGVFSRPPEDDEGAPAAPPSTGARKASTARKAATGTAPAKKSAVAKRPAAKKAVAVKKAAAKKAAPVKKAAVKKAAVKKAAVKKAAPVRKVAAVKGSVAAKRAPAARKRAPTKKAVFTSFEIGDDTASAERPLSGGPLPDAEVQSPPPPPPTGGGFGFGFEPPAAGAVTDSGTAQITSPPAIAPKPSRKDKRGAQRAAEQARAGKAKRGGRFPLLVAALILVLIAAAVAVAVVIANQDDGTDYADLRVGDCVRDVSERPAGPATPGERRSVTEVEVVDCAESHETEVYAITTYPGSKDAPFPGNEEVGRFVSDFCQGPAFEQYVGKARSLSSLIDDDIQPSEISWKAGRRQVICMAGDPGGAELTSSVKGSGR